MPRAATSTSSSSSSSASAPPAASGKQWTTRQLLEWMTGYFRDREVESPRLVGEMLLSHVLECERMRLYMEVDRPAQPDELATLRELVRRAGQHEPVQYLIGEAWFFSRPFHVDRSTLIPRPSTETLVEHALQWCRQHHQPQPQDEPDRTAGDTHADAEIDPDARPGNNPTTAGASSTLSHRLLDLGTGSGCIAISLALQLPHSRVVATDISAAAIEVARANAGRHGAGERIEFLCGSLFEPLAQEIEPFDVICANPPYIPDDQWDAVKANVREYEPSSALRAGADGLEFIRPIVQQAPRFLQPGGLLAVEIAHTHGRAVRDLVKQTGGYAESIRVVKDLDGQDRVLLAQRSR